MLTPDHKRSQKKMTDEQRKAFNSAVAEEMAVREENIAAAQDVAKRLKDERKAIVDLVSQLRATREKAGISLSELEARTGISKSSLSRLENSAAPNPTMLTLHRYAAAIGVTLQYSIDKV